MERGGDRVYTRTRRSRPQRSAAYCGVLPQKAQPLCLMPFGRCTKRSQTLLTHPHYARASFYAPIVRLACSVLFREVQVMGLRNSFRLGLCAVYITESDIKFAPSVSNLTFLKTSFARNFSVIFSIFYPFFVYLLSIFSIFLCLSNILRIILIYSWNMFQLLNRMKQRII